MTHGWKYLGKGERISWGVPTRDLSAQEFASLNPLDQRHVINSDLYRPVQPVQPAKAPKKQEGGEQ